MQKANPNSLNMSLTKDMFREFGFAFCISEVFPMFFKSCVEVSVVFHFMSFVKDMFREFGFAFCISEIFPMFFKSCVEVSVVSSYIVSVM